MRRFGFCSMKICQTNYRASSKTLFPRLLCTVEALTAITFRNTFNALQCCHMSVKVSQISGNGAICSTDCRDIYINSKLSITGPLWGLPRRPICPKLYRCHITSILETAFSLKKKTTFGWAVLLFTGKSYKIARQDVELKCETRLTTHLQTLEVSN